MERDYSEAMAKSYSHQENLFIIPRKDLEKVFKITLGFQPAGIASDGKSKVVVAAYFEPAILQINLEYLPDGLHLKTEWIRGVYHKGESVRIFPDVLECSGANRMQTVNFGPENTLWCTRNADRRIYILSPPAIGSNLWILDGNLLLPDSPWSVLIHSAKLAGSTLTTIESDSSLGNWFINEYDIQKLDSPKQISRVSPYTYGLEIDKKYHLISGTRANRAKELMDPAHCEFISYWVRGDGFCFIEGGALVSNYGQSAPGPFNGKPGRLIYMPAGHLVK